MNWDQVAEICKQLKGTVQEKWGNLLTQITERRGRPA